MQSKTVQGSLLTTLGNDTISCIFMCNLLAFLHWYNVLYQIGKFETIGVVALILVIEALKAIASFNKMLHKFSIRTIIRSLSVLVIMFCVFYIIAVLLGAPVFSQFEETIMFSMLLSSITVAPTLINLGPEETVALFLNLLSSEDLKKPENLYLKVRLILLGAWLGSVVAPLDWDRPWQKWPIPNCFGALVGYVIANLICVLLHFLKKTSKRTGKYSL